MNVGLACSSRAAWELAAAPTGMEAHPSAGALPTPMHKGKQVVNGVITKTVCVFLLGYLNSYAQEAAKDIEEFEHLWVHEAKVLRSHYGAFDFCLPELKLTMEVDGEQHFQGNMFGALGHAVRRHDYEKMCEAWRQGCCMLTDPYFDAADFGAKLEEATDYRSMFPTLHFIMWSTDITNTFGIF
jgi:hypothetical protein